ncbi:D-amino-acid transaminase, chloroplastic-like isoform X2 [Humulus lupulus]|uniref:D-amino-acid transaminase, chloroplastic-like isoform X2 n=1 Tax=Humulus lupulus TaxID=3486 RepID=UPI002B41142C|nr:D-amino-acid transaminase, chloroplastic-like isoform X2 [Humulus lupulus]
MASFSVSSLLKPISQNPKISIRSSNHSNCSKVIPHGFSSLAFGFRVFQRGSWREMRIVTSSIQNEALIVSHKKTTVVAGSGIQTFDIPLLTSSDAIERLKANRENHQGKQQFLAMYSSIFGGITTDPAAMVIPIDDHMVHRGHGVFDTATIMDGYLYELDQHVNRILRSASMAKINPAFDKETLRRILIQTASASKCRNGSIKYWLSVGPGDFQLSPSGCNQPTFYAVVFQDQSPSYSKGIKVITSSVPIKPSQFATTKSVNYLPNVLSKMEAEEQGAFAGIWLDNEGFIAEGPNMNVAFVMKENELLMPQFDKILSGCTANRVLALAEQLVSEGKLQGVRVGNVTVEEGKNATEMMLLGSGILVLPVIQWDDQIIGDEGSVTQALLNLIIEDMKFGPSSVRVPIPY